MRAIIWALAASAASLLLGSVPGHADQIAMKAILGMQEQVPPITGNGKGTPEVLYDPSTRKLSWRVAYSNLTATSTAAHFHGAAMPGTTAPVVIPMPGAEKSPFEGSTTLTEAQAKDPLAGTWYVNIHTATYPSGEIRGMVQKAK